MSNTRNGVSLNSNGVFQVGIIDGGSGYIQDPRIYFVGGGGSGAEGHIISVDGVITSVVMLKPGKGYTSPPDIVFSAGGVPGYPLETATATCTLDTGFLLRYGMSDFQNDGSFDPENEIYHENITDGLVSFFDPLNPGSLVISQWDGSEWIAVNR